MTPVASWRLAVVALVGVAVVPLVPAGTVAPLVAVNLVVLTLAFIDWARAPRASAITITRDLPGIATLGGAVELTWTVTNPTDRPVRAQLADQLAPSLQATTRRVALRVPPGGSAKAATLLQPARRGRFTPAELDVRVWGPWQLVARQARRTQPDTLRVYPPFRSQREAELRIERARILEVGLRSARGRGQGTEFDQLREYTVDDESRRIDWAATARVGKPIVRTYRSERNQRIVLLLDSGRTMAGRLPADAPTPAGVQPELGDAAPLEVPRLDHAMDAAMCLTAVSTRLGDRTGLVAFADRVRAVVPPGHRRDQLALVTEALAELEPELAESDYPGAFAHALTRFRRRALLVLLTELGSEGVTDTLLPALPLIARDHVVVVGAVIDPQVLEWARSVPADATEAYRKSAALDALAQRRRTVARLRGLGVVVVDAPPGKLAGELTDAYLDVKATGRL